jgi:hypothetical protein
MCSFLPSPYSHSYSYGINYIVQAGLYNSLDKKTDDMEPGRLPVFIIWSASSAITGVARISGVVETFFKGGVMLVISPFADSPYEKAKEGADELFCHTSKNVVRLIELPFEYIAGSVYSMIIPKEFIMNLAESTKITLRYAKLKKLGSKEHLVDLSYIRETVNPKFFDYQDRMMEKRRLSRECGATCCIQ